MLPKSSQITKFTHRMIPYYSLALVGGLKCGGLVPACGLKCGGLAPAGGLDCPRNALIMVSASGHSFGNGLAVRRAGHA